ncbi:MAG: SH3 domain-containing protein [Salinibacter sp.]
MPCLLRNALRTLRRATPLQLVLLVLMGGTAAGSLSPATARGQPDSAAVPFERANAAYQEGRYEDAVAQYRQVLETGRTSGALYYNLANTYVRLDRLGQAIRYYEKARPLLGDDPRLAHSLEQARRRAGVYPDALPPRGLYAIVGEWPVRLLFVVGLLLLGAGGAAAVARTTPGGPLPWRAPMVWGPGIAGGLMLAAAFGASAVQEAAGRAVVIADQAAVRSTPDEEASTDATLPEGKLLEVRARQGDWASIRAGEGTTGWVPRRALGDV